MPDTPNVPVLTDETVAAVLDDLAKARQKMTELRNLPPDERRRMSPFSEDDVPFVRRTVEVGRQFPDVLPRSVDVEAQAAGLAYYEQLDRVRIALVAFLELVTDTQRRAADGMWGLAREVYAAVKRSRTESDALDALVRELAKHFEKRPRRSGDA